ncbi:MAG: methyl-accepting chemotaxis protein, partial [Bacteroidales bacterium]|nr:methyl-accepting chemotaxis protein [Bacteroidales bacterium]
ISYINHRVIPNNLTTCIMEDFIFSSLRLILLAIPISIVLIKVLFKNSLFGKISAIWVVSVILSAINWTARIEFEAWTSAFSVPMTTLILTVSVYVASRMLRDPLKAMMGDLKKISTGDIDIKITNLYSSRKDEIGSLAESINLISLNLNKILGNIKKNSKDLMMVSEDLSEIMSTMTENTSTQASSIEEISSTMEEIASIVTMNSDNSQKTSSSTLKTIEAIREGNKSTEESIAAMKEVTDKVKLINDIAFQTNILALNAAVEASHAGEAGKGFAVVANEVKKLAERSNNAAQQIESVTSKVFRISESAGIKLTNIIEDANETSGLIREIASASIDQNTNIQQINDSIQVLNKMIQNNTSEAEKINAKAAFLSSSAKKLNDQVAVFHLRKE